MLRPFNLLSATMAVAAVLTLMPPPQARAAYPTNVCVAKKQKVAGRFCRNAAKAWARFHAKPANDPDGTLRDRAIAVASAKLGVAWAKAEAAAARRDTECVETTLDAATMAGNIAASLTNLQASVVAGLDSANSDDRQCAWGLLRFAGQYCAGVLKSESKYIRDLSIDSQALKRAQRKQKVQSKFEERYAKLAPTCGGTIPASASLISDADSISNDTVFDTTTSPNLPATFQMIEYPVGTKVPYKGKLLQPECSRQTPWSFHYKRGTVNKLVMYYQGGGACWSGTTCFSLPTYKITAGPGDDPSLVGAGLADFNDPDNPFKDWNFVFISYCTGDVHWGNNHAFYGSGQTISHVGRINAQVAEKFAREHFLNPETVVVTGSSAGSYGAWMNSAYLMHDVYHASEFNVLGDAGVGIITREWLDLSLRNWGVQAELPPFIPAFDRPAEELSMVNIMAELALAFPQHRFASYNTAYDGSGGGQSAFYNVMKNTGNPLLWSQWWLETCEFNACMREFVADTASRAPDNFRYYTAAGSRHTVFGSDKLYEDTTGGNPKLIDWLQAMIADDSVNWVNTECGDGVAPDGVGPGCDLLSTCQSGTNEGFACTTDANCPGGSCESDPEPSPLADPYIGGGVVSCPAMTCPCSVAGGPGVVCGD